MKWHEIISGERVSSQRDAASDATRPTRHCTFRLSRIYITPYARTYHIHIYSATRRKLVTRAQDSTRHDNDDSNDKACATVYRNTRGSPLPVQTEIMRPLSALSSITLDFWVNQHRSDPLSARPGRIDRGSSIADRRGANADVTRQYFAHFEKPCNKSSKLAKEHAPTRGILTQLSIAKSKMWISLKKSFLFNEIFLLNIDIG